MDKKIVCLDCGREFTFTENDQKFYAEKGFVPPKRCRACRDARNVKFYLKSKKGEKSNG